jgi:hypothetical protein
VVKCLKKHLLKVCASCLQGWGQCIIHHNNRI